MNADELELTFYRETEDFFAAMRGVPHMLSSKDVHLMRGWWRDQIPPEAVIAGVTEVIARRQAEGNDEPVTSLRYCRHAVRSHARRLAEMRVGAATDPGSEPETDIKPALDALAKSLLATAAAQQARRPEVAAAIEMIAEQLTTGSRMAPGVADEQLFGLESALLENCRRALAAEELEELEQQARTEAEASGATADARQRAFRAVRDRRVREMLGLARLELA